MISMAIKYVVLPEQKQVIAILKNTKYDAYNKAMKLCREMTKGQSNVFICPNMEKLLMANEFKVVVPCKEGDTFDPEVGKRIAKRICLEKYYNSFDKKINRFKKSFDMVKNLSNDVLR